MPLAPKFVSGRIRGFDFNSVIWRYGFFVIIVINQAPHDDAFEHVPGRHHPDQLLRVALNDDNRQTTILAFIEQGQQLGECRLRGTEQ